MSLDTNFVFWWEAVVFYVKMQDCKWGLITHSKFRLANQDMPCLYHCGQIVFPSQK